MPAHASPAPRDRLIVGLDLPDVAGAQAMVARLGDAVSFYKIGYRLGFAGGLDLARRLADEGKQVFIDLKLHDVGNTVKEGVQSITALGGTFLTVHAYPQTMRAAVEGRGTSSLKLLAVTVMTSYDDGDLAEAGYARTVSELVEQRALQARQIGIDGLIVSPHEAARLRGLLGQGMILVTPGVRPAGSDAGGQKRVMTPGDAIRAGADNLVVARPVIAAADPRAAAESITAEIASALSGMAA